MTKGERTGWRDKAISFRHRLWGDDLALMDIDGIFLGIEANYQMPIALVEYKHEFTPPQKITQWSFKVLSNLGTIAGLPVFAVRYANDWSWWNVVPINKKAKEKLPQRKEMSEFEYVSFLYGLRGQKMPVDVRNFLMKTQTIPFFINRRLRCLN